MPTNPEQESPLPNLPESPAEQVSPEDEANIRGGGSVYIGETEKNLNRVIGPAKRTDVNLLFNEGDSLFKK